MRVNILSFSRCVDNAAPPVVMPFHPDRRFVDVIEHRLREACSLEPDVMIKLFARVVDHHLASTLDRTGPKIWLEQALDEVLTMIPMGAGVQSDTWPHERSSGGSS